MSVKHDDERKIILVVDDIAESATNLKTILGKEYFVRITNSGNAALKAVTVDPLPNLILLDVMMPDMDGYAVCRQLKADNRTREIPIIFVTGKSEVEDELQGLTLGAVDYITKPFHPPIVLARIKSHLAMQSAHAQLLELNKILKDLVTIDGLTGIPNRRRFDEYLIQEWNRALRDRTPISLIVIDIDYFKLFNDNYGHSEGDECLKKIAKTLLASMVRAIDLMARYGGEEFVCILPKTDTSGLIRVGNQLRENINGLRIPHEYSKAAQHVTISLGGATMIPSQGALPYLLVGKADTNLYKAKDGGRNRLVVE